MKKLIILLAVAMSLLSLSTLFVSCQQQPASVPIPVQKLAGRPSPIAIVSTPCWYREM